MEHKVFPAEVKAADEEKLIVEHFISTESRDRVGDIMRASGMKVRGKPVVLLGHGHESAGYEPIARPLSIKRGEFKGVRGVVAKTQFFPDEMGKRLYEKTVKGYMPSWSIGFMTLRSEPIRYKDGKESRGGRDIKEWELLEYSLVGVPAQPDAQTIGPVDKDGGVLSVKFVQEGESFPLEVDGAKQAEPVTVETDEEKDAETETVYEADEVKSASPPAPEEPLVPAIEVLNARLEKILAHAEELSEAFKQLLVRLDPPAPEAEPVASVPEPPEQVAKESNPPEEKKPTRLVIVRREPSAEERRKKETEAIVALARKVAEETYRVEVNRLKGKIT